ncbi:OpgC family protein [Neorhizobium sp. DT-125]|uniref:OpgC family protein n=1 Tax=Neorhizobium sp. DT-125 TaxID=3396163 RepID=UPI003F1C049F
MKRHEIIDGLRGYFLVFMLINHLVFVGGYWMLLVNHNQLAFVEDAQGFVFLSGLLVGMVYSRKMAKNGYRQARQQLWARAFEIYRYAMLIVMAVLVAQMALPDAHRIWHAWLGYTTFGEPLRLAAIAALLFQPTFMDILPQYVVYMIFAPPIIWFCLNGKWAHVVVGSLILWMAGQLGLQRLATESVNGWIVGSDQQGVRASFNLFGWQIVFFSGLVIGVLTANRKIDWSKVFRPEATLVPKLCLAVCLFFLPLRIASAHDLLPQFVLAKFTTMEIRADFGPVYIANFLAVAVGLVWLLMAGPRHENIHVRRLAAGLTWLFSAGFLRLLGRHSLHVYVWHVAIVYMVFYVDQQTPEFSQFTKTLIALISIMLLSLPALWRERDRFIGGPPAKLANG